MASKKASPTIDTTHTTTKTLDNRGQHFGHAIQRVGVVADDTGGTFAVYYCKTDHVLFAVNE